MTIQYQFCNWQEQQNNLMSVRTKVFVEEQNVPVELENDEHDALCLHIIAIENDKPIATARLLSDGHIGRMCVLREYRLQGIASEMLFMLIKHAFNTGIKKLQLNAQINAIPFYQKPGFEVCSEVFLDAGIEHQSMQLDLS